MPDSRNDLSMRRRNAPLRGRNPAQSAFNLAVLTQIMLQGILSTTSVFCILSPIVLISCRVPSTPNFKILFDSYNSVLQRQNFMSAKKPLPLFYTFFPPPELSCSVVSSSSSSSCATVELCAGACARLHARTHALASVRVRAGTSLLTDCLRLQLAEAAAPLPSLCASTLS